LCSKANSEILDQPIESKFELQVDGNIRYQKIVFVSGYGYSGGDQMEMRLVDGHNQNYLYMV